MGQARFGSAAFPLASIGPAGTGPYVTGHAGRQLANQELAERSASQRVLDWIQHVLGGVQSAIPGGWFGLIVLVVVAVLLVVLVIAGLRPARARRADRPVRPEPQRTARQHRGDAERLAAAGDFGAAIVETVRAIAAEVTERQILPVRPGRTADELAAEAGARIPALAADMRSLARLFDDIRYGGRPGTEQGYRLARDTDEAIRAARSEAAQAPDQALAAAVRPW